MTCVHEIPAPADADDTELEAVQRFNDGGCGCATEDVLRTVANHAAGTITSVTWWSYDPGSRGQRPSQYWRRTHRLEIRGTDTTGLQVRVPRSGTVYTIAWRDLISVAGAERATAKPALRRPDRAPWMGPPRWRE